MKVLLIALLLLFFCVSAYCVDTTAVCFPAVCVRAELATTHLQRQKGLMFRPSLPDDGGMLFIFEGEGRHAIWMKNMHFAIDIIWFDKDRVVVDIRQDVPPCGRRCETLVPSAPAAYVLEVNAGFARRNGVAIGQQAKF